MFLYSVYMDSVHDGKILRALIYISRSFSWLFFTSNGNGYCLEQQYMYNESFSSEFFPCAAFPLVLISFISLVIPALNMLVLLFS